MNASILAEIEVADHVLRGAFMLMMYWRENPMYEHPELTESLRHELHQAMSLCHEAYETIASFRVNISREWDIPMRKFEAKA